MTILHHCSEVKYKKGNHPLSRTHQPISRPTWIYKSSDKTNKRHKIEIDANPDLCLVLSLTKLPLRGRKLMYRRYKGLCTM